MGLVAWGCGTLRDRVRPGGLFALYLVIAGVERFLVEFVRRNEPRRAGLTAAQLESLALFVAGVADLRIARLAGCSRRPVCAHGARLA